VQYDITVGDRVRSVAVARAGDGWRVVLDGTPVEVHAARIDGARVSLLVNWIVPVYPVAVLPWTSSAVTVTSKATPAACGVVAVTSRVAAAPGFTVSVASSVNTPLVPVTVWAPATVAVQLDPVHEPSGAMLNVVPGVTLPRLLPNASNPSAVYAWLSPAIMAMIGASDPRVELGRWDVPGAYIVGRAAEGAWELEKTASGTALEPPPELWILACVEIGRLDGWY